MLVFWALGTLRDWSCGKIVLRVVHVIKVVYMRMDKNVQYLRINKEGKLVFSVFEAQDPLKAYTDYLILNSEYLTISFITYEI